MLVFLYHYWPASSISIKFEFRIVIFSSVYIHLIFDYRETTGMFNKDTPTLENLIWIWLYTNVLDTTWIPQNVVILRHHLSKNNMILLELFLLHIIILNSIYFVRPTMKLFKPTEVTLGTFKIVRYLGINLNFIRPI